VVTRSCTLACTRPPAKEKHGGCVAFGLTPLVQNKQQRKTRELKYLMVMIGGFIYQRECVSAVPMLAAVAPDVALHCGGR
jgi:hypothetical protein